MTHQDDCVFIEIRFKTGKVLRAEGDHAKEVWDWLQSGESMNFIHGARYTGKPMATVDEVPQ